MQPKDSSIFADVSDYFGIDNPAIAEKDYYVVQLLKLLASHYCQHHTMVFAGGTALAKADVKLSFSACLKMSTSSYLLTIVLKMNLEAR